VVIYWPRGQMEESVSVFCNFDETKTTITFQQTTMDYEVVVLLETQHIPVTVQNYSRNLIFFSKFFTKTKITVNGMLKYNQNQKFGENIVFELRFLSYNTQGMDRLKPVLFNNILEIGM